MSDPTAYHYDPVVNDRRSGRYELTARPQGSRQVVLNCGRIAVAAVVAMHSFTSLEQLATNAILDKMVEGRAIIETQLFRAEVLSRENTGGGFLLSIKGARAAEPLDLLAGSLGRNIWLGIAGLKYGLGAILQCKEDRISLLEG